jgi:phosphate transport system substrate-binding protein
MAQKNETVTLVLAFLITAGVLGGGIWLFTGGNFNRFFQTADEATPITPVEGEGGEGTVTTDAETFGEVQGVPSGLFNYGGSTTWAPIRGEVDPVIQSVYPKFQLRYTDPVSGAPGSGTGIEMLLNDQLAFSQSSRSLKTEEYEAAQQRGFTLRQIPVAIDGIAVAVNPTLNIRGLTVNQIKDIYRGRITNWSQVGGPNLAITPYSRPQEAGGTVEFFVGNILADEEFGNNVELVGSTTSALRALANNPGGIYYASAPEVVPQCTIKPISVGRQPDQLVAPYQDAYIPPEQCPNQRNTLEKAAFQSGDYPITRRLFVIVKENGQQDEQAGLAYARLLLSDQGQELVDQSGFVSIR